MKDIFLTAAKENNIQLIKELLAQNKMLLEETNDKGCTALYLAAKSAAYDTAEFLLRENANPNHMSANGWSPLHAACKMQHLNIVQLLLSYHTTYIDWNQNPLKFTPLHLVVNELKSMSSSEINSNGKKIVEVLLSEGADLELQDINGETVIDIAKKNKDQGLIYVIEQELTQRENGYDIKSRLSPTSSEVDSKYWDYLLQEERSAYERTTHTPCPPAFMGYAWKFEYPKRVKTPMPTLDSSKPKSKGNRR